MNRIAN